MSRVHHLGLTVGDLDRSLRFYRDLLGFTLLGRRTADAPYLSAQTGYDGLRLDVASLRLGPEGMPTLEMVQYLTHPGDPLPSATHLPATAHVCLQVDDLADMVARLKGEGVRLKSEPVSITAGPNRGGLGVYLFDPDGFIVELFQPPKVN